MVDAKDNRSQKIVEAINKNTTAIGNLRRTLERSLRPLSRDAEVVEQPPMDDHTPPSLATPENPVKVDIDTPVQQPVPHIHLAFMDPADPRPTCWTHTGLGGKFTITNFEEHVNCKKCLDIIEANR
jgi:hypothetical protein